MKTKITNQLQYVDLHSRECGSDFKEKKIEIRLISSPVISTGLR